jgi:hypothetical protein
MSRKVIIDSVSNYCSGIDLEILKKTTEKMNVNTL